MLQKQPVEFGFSRGLDTKTDPFRVNIGNFLRLQNMVFTTGSRLTKRNGYGELSMLPDVTANFITTFKDNLTAIGNNLQAFNESSETWVNKGQLQPLQLNTLSLIRSSTNQSQLDSVVSSNGLVCTVYTDQDPTSLATPQYKYVVADSITGQNIIAPTIITGCVNAPRVFVLGNYFVIVYGIVVVATNHLEFISINFMNTSLITTPVSLTAQYTPSSTLAFDGIEANNNLYIAWNGSDGGGAIRVSYIDSHLLQHGTVSFAGHSSTLMSVSADTSGSTANIYVSFWDTTSTNGYTLVVNQALSTVLTPTQIITTTAVLNLTAVATQGLQTVFYEVNNNYSYDSSIPTHFIRKVTITQSGSVGSTSIIVRSVGIASKAFIVNNDIYLLAVYFSLFQSTYFLIDQVGKVVAKVAYSNAGGYLITGLPSITVSGNSASIGYLIKDLVEAVNKTQGLVNAAGVYTQTGLNLVTFNFNDISIISEIGNDLHLTGGFLWMYDGYSPVEHNFHVWPDNVEGVSHTTGGGLSPQVYFAQVTYEWTDNQGNIHRSAPSIPTKVDLSAATPTPITFTSVFTSGVSSITVSSVTGLFIGQFITDNTTGGNIQPNTTITSIVGSVLGLSLPTAGASAGGGDTLQTIDTLSITWNIPTLRLTYKLSNPVKIAIYRWSTSQENYYETTTIKTPLLNDITIDSVSFLDTNADATILGNALIYTTGGVIENIAAPASSTMTLFDSRLWSLDSEDRNLLWFSKQVIEGTPVEMSDLFTYFVSPSAGAQGSTGDIKCLSAMDDKLIIFKQNALIYTNGTGPDNTGTNDGFSQPTFITSTVGCSNQQSIVFMQDGLMFQSDKGIWLLGRDLSTRYIGAAVEQFTNGAVVQSAVNVPATTQVRFTLNTGITLMYDYFYDQWGTFINVPAISSTLYKSLHTYLNSLGQVFQETPGKYLDGSSPVLQAFSTSWIAASGLQGFQRAYWMYILGTYLSPHKLNIQIAYDYEPSPSQSTVFTPDNFNPAWGVDSPWGNSATWGGASNIEQERIMFDRQKCEAFQVIIDEVFDSSFGQAAGAGLTLTSLNLTIGRKKSYPTVAASQQTG